MYKLSVGVEIHVLHFFPFVTTEGKEKRRQSKLLEMCFMLRVGQISYDSCGW